MNSAAFIDYQGYAEDKKNDSSLLTKEVIKWAYALALPIVGILMLCLLLSLGDAFALLGPWGIFIAVRLITHCYDKKIGKIETIEVQRDNF